MADVDMRDVLPVGQRPAHRLMDGAEGRAPADYGKLGAFPAEADLLVGNGVRDAEHLGVAGVGHLLVGGRAVVDVAGSGLLLDAADAVLKAGSPWLDPRPREPVAAGVGHDALP